jgi:hypothetical protein
MESDTDRSLEVDQLDHPLEPSPTTTPVVLVQYRNRGVPFWLLIPLVIIVSMSAISVYHSLVVARHRAQAAGASHALVSQIDQSQALDTEAVQSKPVEPLALNSQPFVPAAATLAPTPVPLSTTPSGAPSPSVAAAAWTTPIESATPSLPGGAAKVTDSDSRNPVSSRPITGSGSDPIAGLLSMPTRDDKRVAAAGKSTHSPVQSILENPIISFGQAGKAAAPTDVAERTVASENSSKGGKGSPEDLRGSTAPKSGEGGGEPASVVQGESGIGEVVDVKTEPLPTKEESLRQIEDEAAKKQAEIDGLDASMQAELHAKRQSERLKFRDELRALLQAFGNRAGPEIDELSKRNGYDVDREKFARARNAWRYTRMSTESRVRFTRSLDLPEAVILNFLSDEIYLQIGTRDGPRNKNEGRIRAARMLLNFQLPTAGATASPAQPVPPNPGVDSPKRQKRATSGKDVGARAR